jgi:hypothetical protein
MEGANIWRFFVMRKFFGFGSLSLLVIVSMGVPAFADECKKIHGTIVDAQVIEGCTSPNKFCAEGTVTGNHGLNGTTYFVMDGVVRGPATLPGSLATSGVLVYTTDGGTLTVRESGLSGLAESGQGYFTAFQQVLEGTGEYEGATGHLWVLGRRLPDHFEADLIGEICLP